MMNKRIETTVFESERLRFRKLKPIDAGKLFEIYSNEEAMRFRKSPPMKSLEDAMNFIRHQTHETDTHYSLRKGIELKNTEELIGSVLYLYHKNKISEYFIGYSIGEKYWRRGFGRELVGLLIESLRDTENIQHIKAWTKTENIASQKILEFHNFEKFEQDEFPDSFLYHKDLS